MAKKKAKKKARKSAKTKVKKTTDEWISHRGKCVRGKTAPSESFEPAKMSKASLDRVVEVPKGPSPSRTPRRGHLSA